MAESAHYEITIVPTASITIGRLVVFANRVQDGKECASSKEATIEVIESHRQRRTVKISAGNNVARFSKHERVIGGGRGLD